jgi:SAM-dependent methyltransferase
MVSKQVHNNMEPSSWVKKCAEMVIEGGSVLDVACGKGRHTRYFLAKGHSVTAVDIDTTGLDDIADNRYLGVIEADLELFGWPFGGMEYDAIVVTNYLHRPMFPDLIETLAPGGVLIYETFALGNEAFGKPSNPDFLLRENELRDYFGRHLQVLCYEQVFEENPTVGLKQRICAIKSDAKH